MSLNENKIIVRRFFEELWNERKLEVADEIFAGDCITHQLQSGKDAPAARRNAEAVKEHINEWLTGFPDLRFTVEQMIAEADEVVSQAVMRGTHAGIWHGIPPTGKSVSIRMTVRHRVANKKIVEDWVLVESYGFFEQLGLALPAPEIIARAAAEK